MELNASAIQSARSAVSPVLGGWPDTFPSSPGSMGSSGSSGSTGPLSLFQNSAKGENSLTRIWTPYGVFKRVISSAACRNMS